MGSRRSGSQNALLRQVRQYANSSALFRKTESLETAVSPAPITTEGERVVRGYLQAAPSNLPVGQTAVFPQTSLGFPAADLDMPSAPLLPLPTPTVEPALLSAPTPLPVPPTTSEPLVQAAPESSDEDWGGEWRRMKRILQGHTAKKTEEAEPTASEAAVQRAISAAEASSKPAPLSSQPPLQNADWPVISKKPELPGKSKAVKPAPLPTPTPQQEEQIRAKLSGITASQPTDSSIEIHLPRRPRPTAPQSGSPPAPVQRQESTAPESTPSSIPDMVPTEIGPLPADMWEILGEPVPVSTVILREVDEVARSEDEEGNEAAASPQIVAGAGPGEAVQRAIAAVEATSSSGAAANLRPTLPGLTDDVLMETAVPAPTSQRQPETAAAATESGDDEQPPAAQMVTGATAHVEAPSAGLSDQQQAGGKTAVQPPNLQRQLEPSATLPTTVEPEIKAKSSLAVREAVQRAITQAEKPAFTSTETGEETTVEPPSVQHQPAAVALTGLPAQTEIPPMTPRQPEAQTTQTLLQPGESSRPQKSEKKRTAVQPATPEAVQRAIAAAESSADETPAASPLSPTSLPASATTQTPGSESGDTLPVTTGVEMPASTDTPSLKTTAASLPQVQHRSETSPAAVNPLVPEPGTSELVTPSRQAATNQPANTEAVQRATAAAEAPTARPGEDLPALSGTVTADSMSGVQPQSAAAASLEAMPQTVARVEAAAAPFDIVLDTAAGETAVVPQPAQPQPAVVLAVKEHESAGEVRVQRAIAAAEAPSAPGSQPETDSVKVATATAVPIAPSQRQPTVKEAVPPATSPAYPEAIQRGVTHRETAAPVPYGMPEEPTAVQPPPMPRQEILTALAELSEPTPLAAETSMLQAATPEAVQRAIARVETPLSTAADVSPSLPERATALPGLTTPHQPEPPPTLLPLPQAEKAAEPILDEAVVLPAAPEAVQRAIAAVEAGAVTEWDISGPQGAEETAVSPAQTVQQQSGTASTKPSSSASQPGSAPVITSALEALSPDQLATPEAVRRAIAAAQVPSSVVNNMLDTADMAQAAAPETVQRAIAAAEAAPTIPTNQSLTLGEATAVPASTSQQQPEPGAATAVAPAPVILASQEVVQQAIAAAEAPATPLPISQPLAETTLDAFAARPDVSQPTITAAQPMEPTAIFSASPAAMQRAIARAESPTAAISQLDELRPPAPPSVVSQPYARGEAMQRVIAAAEAPTNKRPSTPLMPEAQLRIDKEMSDAPGKGALATASQARTPAVSSHYQAALQRALAAAEAPANSPPRLEAVASDVWQIRERPSYGVTSTTAPLVMRSLAGQALLADSQAVDDQSTTSTIPLIQRAEINETADSTKPGVGTEASQSNSTSVGQDVDIDDLARKVYAQLKRRLALEWERGRGKR